MKAEKCNAYVGVGKAFIRWLDHSILEFFIEGLRKTKLIVEAENEGIKLHRANFSNLINEKENRNLEVLLLNYFDKSLINVEMMNSFIENLTLV